MAFETNDAFAETFTEIGKAAPPRYLGIRFDVSGRFLPTPGNTVVSHVVAGSRTQAALARIRQALIDLPTEDVDTIELRAPAFCVFPDMTEFTPLRFL